MVGCPGAVDQDQEETQPRHRRSPGRSRRWRFTQRRFPAGRRTLRRRRRRHGRKEEDSEVTWKCCFVDIDCNMSGKHRSRCSGRPDYFQRKSVAFSFFFFFFIKKCKKLEIKLWEKIISAQVGLQGSMLAKINISG